MRKVHKIKQILLMLVALIAFSGYGTTVQAEEYDSGPLKVIYDVIGHYSLNYTGNTNHYDYWNATGTSKIISRNYKDRTDISTKNNSSATLSPSDSESTLKYAFLIWQSRSEDAPTEAIRVVAPTGAWGSIPAQWVCKDIRTNASGEEYVGVYTMAAEVTDLVCSDVGGYGTYTVANIPVWDGSHDGEVICGGESVASWQLVVVEESPNYPVRTISLNILSQYFFDINYTVNVSFADASAPNGTVSAQFLDGEINVDCPRLYDGIGYPDDYNYIYNGLYFRYLTQTRGLYKNGVCINNRDTGAVLQTGASAIGATRVHLFDDYRRGNSVGSQAIEYKYKGTNWGTNIFMFGVSIDVFAYDIVFDGNGADAGSMDHFTCVYGRGYNLPANRYTKQYYKVESWNTKPDGSGTSYMNKQFVRNLTATEDEVVLYAQWVPDPYKITLDNQQAAISGTKAYYEWYGYGNYETETCINKISTITLPEKKGYTFNGYYTQKDGRGVQCIDAGGMILATSTTFDGDTTLYAYWTEAVYEITLDNQGADSSGTTVYYEKFNVGNYTTADCVTKITQIEIPTKEHYTFGGYYTEKNGDGKQVIDMAGKIAPVYTMFSKDTTLYARWNPKTYIISLESQDATDKGTLAYYEKYGEMNYLVLGIIDSNTERVVETFEYTGSPQVFIAPYTGTYDLTVFGASGEGSGKNTGSFCSLVTGSVTLIEGEILYIYVGGQGENGTGGWNGGGNASELVSWTDARIDVTAGGGATDIRRGGTSFTDRILVASGGAGSARWQKTDGSASLVKIIITWGLTSNHIVYLQNELSYSEFISPVSTYMFEGPNQQNAGGSSGILTTIVNTSTGEPYYLEISRMRTGRFGMAEVGGGGGWYGGGAANVNARSINGSNIYHMLTAPTPGSCYVDGVTNSIVWGIYFSWEAAINGSGYRYSKGTNKENYYNEDGEVVDCIVDHGQAIITYDNYLKTSQMAATSITIPKKNGYIFGGYYTKKDGDGIQYVDASGNILSTPTTFEENITLYAYWIASDTQTYQIAFNGNGADEGKMNIMTCEFNRNYMLNANQFTKKGYTFAGWSIFADGSVAYTDMGTVNNLSTQKGDVVTLYAQWVPGTMSYNVRHYTESLKSEWELHSTDIKFGITDSSLTLVELVKTISGYSYDHAEIKGNNATSCGIWADGSLVINLYYTRNSYTVTLEKDTGIASVEGAGTYKYEETVNIEAVTASGYVWSEWSGLYQTLEKTYTFHMPAEDVLMKASTKSVVYTIYLENQQATEPGTLQYYEKYNVGNFSDRDCNQEITTITVPKKRGYTFGGYYIEETGGTQYIDIEGNILSGAGTFTRDTVLYAKWIPITYRIHFEGNGATDGSMEDMICTYGTQYQINANQYVKNKYRFVGWNTKADSNGLSYLDRSYLGNLCETQDEVITLYAQWTPNTYIVRFDANGGEGAMNDMVCEFQMDYMLNANQFIKTGYAFMGWSLLPDGPVEYKDQGIINNIKSGPGIVTLYAIWDNCPWIIAENLYYTLTEAQNGFITYDELMSQAVAADLEDGNPIQPGIDVGKGTSFVMIDYLPTDFTQFTGSGSVTETYQVIDSAGNEYKKMITVHVVDTAAEEILPEGTTRFIDEKYYNESYENGGLKEGSVWKIDPEYVEALLQAFINRRNNTPFMRFSITYEKIQQMKEYIKVNGFGNSKSTDALQRFFDEFLIFAHTN